MFDLPVFQSTTNPPRRRRRLAGAGQKPGVELLERRELLDAGLAAGLTSAAASRLLGSLYNDLLNRAPQPTELAAWQNAVTSGQNLQNVAQAFLSSPEYQADFITDTYTTLLKRQPQASEVNGWLQATQAGLSEEGVTSQFLASEEYYQGHGSTPEGWLTGLYWDLFQRTPDAAGFFLWRNELQSGMSRETITSDFVTSSEANTRFVAAGYQQFLGRTPDASGEASWVAALDARLSRTEFLAALLGSAEYALTHSSSTSDLPSNPAANGSPADFAFGPAWSSAAQGSTEVALVSYSPQTGYGWDSVLGLVEQDGGGITGSDNSFRVDLPNGTYTVTPTFGNTTVAHSNMAVWAQGVQEVAGLNTAAGQFIRPSFNVQVTNGQLVLRFTAEGAGNTFALHELDIVPTPASSASTVTTNDGTSVASSGTTDTMTTGDTAGGLNSGPSTSSLSQTSPGGDASLTPPTASGISANLSAITLTGKALAVTVSINGAPASSTVNLPIAVTSTVSDPNPGAATAGFKYIWRVITNNVTVASATTPSFTFTPQTAGTYYLRLAVTDEYNLTGTATTTLGITAPSVSLTVSPSSLPNATANRPYSATLNITGGSGSYSFAVTSGQLPAGLSLNASTGVVSGTPTTAGSSSFTITASDSKIAGLSGSQAYTLTVNPVVNPGGNTVDWGGNKQTGTAASITGGSGGTTYISGYASERLLQDGTISQVKLNIAKPGSFKFKLFRPDATNPTNYDWLGDSNTLTASTTGYQIFTPTGLPVNQPGDLLGIYLPAGGAAVWTTASSNTILSLTGDISSGNTNFTNSTTGSLDMQVLGPAPFAVIAGDSIAAGYSPDPAQRYEAYFDYTPPLSTGGPQGDLAHCPGAALRALEGPSFTYQNLAKYGGWWGFVDQSVMPGSPVGIAEAKPTAIIIHCGINDVSRGVSDPSFSWANELLPAMNSILASLAPGQHLFIDEILPTAPATAGLQAAVANTNANYASWCNANSSKATLVPMFAQFADANGQLLPQYNADGIHLSQAGVNLMAQIWQKALASYYSTSTPSLAVSPGTLPSATLNIAYSSTVSATGGSGTYSFAVTSGNLPLGLSLNANTGVVSGTPTTAGTSSFTITATDSNRAGLTGSQAYALTVNPATGGSPIVVNAGANVSTKEGAAIQFAATVTGGTAPYKYSWDFGDGDKASGSLTPSYTYANTGAYTVTLAVTDAKNQVAQSSLQVTVQDVAPSVSISGAPVSSTVGTRISLTSAVTSPSTTDMAAGFSYAWSITKDGSPLHAGTAQNFSFTPNVAATYVASLTVTAKDGATGTASQTITVTGGGVSSGPLSVSINGAPASSPEGAPISLTSTVSSSSAANMAAGFSYSWNVTKDGAAFTTATTPNFNFKPTDRGTYVITLTAMAQDKTTGTASQTITVSDVAPLVTINGAPTNSTLGTAISLTSSVFSPSTADTAAGYRFAWSVTSNGTAVASGENANFSFTPANAATYAVALTVTDKDGATGTSSQTITVTPATAPPPPTGDFITTEYDKIPNFGANPNIVSTTSGAWSNPSTWSLGRVPQTGDVVSINPNTTVSYDTASNAAINTVIIQSGGSLVFRTDISTTLTVVNLLVLQGGDLQIGTASNPVAPDCTAQVVFADQPINTSTDPGQYGNGLIGLGTVTMYGTAKPSTYITLAAEPHAGDTTLTLSQAATGWQVGDELTLPDTRQLLSSERFGNYTAEWEVSHIQSISQNGTVLTLTSPLQFDHVGARDAKGVLDLLPQVGDLTHNIVIRSQNPAGTRGYVMFTDRANVDVRYTQFTDLGRTTLNVADNTTFDSNGNVTHLGTNESDRDPITILHLMGPITTPADGYQFTLQGNSCFSSISPVSVIWPITLNDSDYGLIENNVVFNWAGAGIVTETGAESYNLFQNNLVVGILGNISWRNLNERYGGGFYIDNHTNSLVNNVAADCVQDASPDYLAGIGFVLNTNDTGVPDFVKVPLVHGADMKSAAQYQTLDMRLVPLAQFSGNEAYGGMAAGLVIQILGTDRDQDLVGTTSMGTVLNFTTWHVWDYAFYNEGIQNLTFNGYIVRGEARTLVNPADGGNAWTSKVWAGNITIENADIQGMLYGIGPYSANNAGTLTIQNSIFCNYTANIVAYTPSSEGTPIPSSTYQIVNDQFIPYPGAPSFTSIWMDYATTGFISANLIVPTEVFVTNYNLTGNNFQVFWSEQAASFTVPQTVPSPPGSGLAPFLQGSPVAGLTNAQNWAQFGIAIAGAIAPSTATTMDGIIGLVQPD